MWPDHASEPDSILEAVACGDRSAFERLYDRYAPLVYSLALRINRVQADAEDLVQEVFLQVWRRAETYRPERGSVEAWLLTITRNRALDRHRAFDTRNRAHQSLRDLSGVRVSEPASSPALRDESRLAVRSALTTLSDDQRRVLELAYFDGLSQSQIALSLGLPLGTVKTRIRSGLERLRGLLNTGETPERVE